MEEVGVKFSTEGEAQFYNALAKALQGVNSFDDALDKMSKQEKNSAALEQVRVKLDSMTQAERDAALAAVQMANQTENANKPFKVLGLSLTDLKSGFDMAFGAAQKGAQAVEKTWDATGGATERYSDQVRELIRLSGASAEGASRQIQALDDLDVSFETLEKASKAAADQGISLTVEKMAALQEQYQKIQDPAARLDFLTKTFGKSGSELAKVLEVDADKFRELAASQSSNLILTQKQVDQAREMEKAQDAWNDTLTGFGYVIGNAVMPAATRYLQALTDLLDLSGKINNVTVEGADTYDEYKKAVAASTEAEMQNNVILNALIGYYPLLAGVIRGTSKATVEMSEEQWNASKAQATGSDRTRALKDDIYNLAEQVNKLRPSLWGLKGDEDQAAIAELKHANSAKDVTDRLAQLKAGADELSKSLQSQITVGMSLSESNKKYEDSYWGIQNSIVTLSQSIDALSRLKYRTPEQEKALADMRGDLVKQQDAMDDLTEQHTIDTNKMIFNMVLQKAASDGLTKTEFENLMHIGVGMGLLTQADANMALALNSINLDQANTTLDGFYQLVNSVNGGSTAAATSVESATDRMNAIRLNVARGEISSTYDNYGRVQSASNLAAQQMEAATARMNEIRLGVARGELAPVDALLRSIMSQPSEKHVTVTTDYYEKRHGGDQGDGAAPIDPTPTPTPTPTPVPPDPFDPHAWQNAYSNGGIFRIPSVYGNEGFNMGGIATASAGETVMILPPGVEQLFSNTIRAIGSLMGGGGVSQNIQNSNQTAYNLQVMTNQSPALVQQSFEMMRLLA